ncbi:UDP-glucuronic acid decarboxylase family protein [Streptomyces sp. BA2]|uniref:UDP-glucuronic acid decarboxylase family protein n=1 Tax=Streptomyces sp. BA2 TaxID=436595 RepID=UPI0013210C7F|nr:UDP-glucuronic acid decarboxylase family protein [Streptomyces sp. BA2]MWA07863.1 NAD-dependent epimerase/dehydratase family protein [Streptomyces sp. BA2]
MRAVVTGGAGFIGAHLCERLLNSGFDELLCLDNFLTGRREDVELLAGHPGFELVDCDVSEPLDVVDEADVILHFASPASPADYLRHPLQTLRVGAEGTRRMLDLATRTSARFVLASTSETYGNPQVHPQPETYWGHVNPIGPRSCLDEAKRFAEATTMAYRRSRGTNTAIIRIFNTYGPRMRSGDSRVVPTLIHQALDGQPLTVTGDGSQTRSLCYIDDLIDGVVRMTESDIAGPVNLGNPEEVSMLELARIIRDMTGTGSDIVSVPLPQNDPERRKPVISRARTLLGWAPRVPLVEGLDRTIRWFAERADAQLSDSALAAPRG